jgi:anaerobic magnesium-protoporphyrin IX monomethyl ester cyclase
MAKFVFVQEEFRDRFGFMYLSAALKKAGHTCEVIINDATGDLIGEVQAAKADMIGLSTMTAGIAFATETGRRLKEATDTPILMGGAHPTFYPEVLSEDFVDAICVGEGESPVVEVADHLDAGADLSGILNIHAKVNGDIVRGEMRTLVDPDEVPFPDWDLYFSKYPVLREEPTKRIYVVRGCPYDCSYCFNHTFKALSRGKGKYVRTGSVERVIQEMKFIKENNGEHMRWLQIISDTLNVNRNWFMELMTRYRDEIAVPFLCTMRIDRLDEEMVALLKEAGCDRVDYAIETGNEEIRRNVLNRTMTNETITTAGRLFNKYDIRVQTANMIGIPHETPETILQTVRVNQSVRPEVAKVALFQPFDKTELRNYAMEHGFIEDESEQGTHNFEYRVLMDKNPLKVVLKLKDKHRILNMFYFFDWMVQHPRLEKLFVMLSHLPTNRFFKFLHAWRLVRLDLRYAGRFSTRALYLSRLMKILVTG